MDQWDTYFPPLNLWNYSVYWKWFENESLSDGDVLASTWRDSRDGNTIGDDR